MTFLDPVTAAKKADADGRLPYVFPEEFYYKYKEQPDGSQKPEVWVKVGKKGQQNPQITPMRWRDVERNPDLLHVLKPYHDNWLAGQGAPVNGTALEAWMADPALIKVLNAVHVRSVEDFAKLEDHLLTRLNIPSIREKQRRARAFLDAQQSTAAVSKEVSELREKNESLVKELAELRQLIEQHAIKKDQDVQPKRRGRPPKEAIQ